MVERSKDLYKFNDHVYGPLENSSSFLRPFSLTVAARRNKTVILNRRFRILVEFAYDKLDRQKNNNRVRRCRPN